jgi:hypothetical protein
VDDDTPDADSIDRDESDDNSEKEESSVDSLDEDSEPNVKKGKCQTTQTLGTFELKLDYILPNPSHQITVEFTQLLQQHGLAVIDNANGIQFFKEMTYAEVTAKLQEMFLMLFEWLDLQSQEFNPNIYDIDNTYESPYLLCNKKGGHHGGIAVATGVSYPNGYDLNTTLSPDMQASRSTNSSLVGLSFD